MNLKKITVLFLIVVMITPIFAGCGPREGWMLSAPSYKGGKLADNVYNIGDGITYSAEAVGGKLAVIRDTNNKEFKKYLKTLTKNGYTKIAEHEISNNFFVEFKNNDHILYVYYVGAFKEVRIIEDYVSVPVDEFEYTYEPKEGQTTTFYQYGLMTDPQGSGNADFSDGKYKNNGMFYIIRLSDNSLILIDGGANYQASKKGTQELMDFLREITGTSENEKIRISNIIITHAHADHKKYVEYMLKYHSDEIVVERAMYNFPSLGILKGNSTYDDFGKMLKEKYPDIKFLKPHTGQKIRLADLQMEIAFTHEDFVSPETGLTQIVDFNNTSTIIKYTVNDRTLMFLGDIGGPWQGAQEDYSVFETRFLTMYTDDSEANDSDFVEYGSFLCSDVVQVAHHGINHYMDDIYYAIEPEYAFFPQVDVKLSQMYHGAYKLVLAQLSLSGVLYSKVFFMSRYTHALTIDQNGDISVEKLPILGVDEGYEDMIAKYEPFN